MAVAEDKSNTLAIVTIGVASVLLLWASVVALQAYYENSFGSEMERARAEGQGAELRTLRAEQRATLGTFRRNDDGTVRMPVELAGQIVVRELRTGHPDSLVPAVGAPDPDIPATWGQDDPEDAEDAEDAEADAEEVGDAEGADDAEDTEDAPESSGADDGGETEPSPTRPQRGIDHSQDDTPSPEGADDQEGDDGARDDAPRRDGD